MDHDGIQAKIAARKVRVDGNADSEAFHRVTDEAEDIRHKAKAGPCNGCQEACMH